ncbi:hypothetical protein H8356DRAFT_1635896 [Neocallimastix lanati (nom. inval.)]|jgi:cytidylate kinase|uniref:(d)CMP kinase n=1 Tax=Neocallimastix californiae TaxID=1754190 RepID=A0A1Y2ESW1_9FUNG|nr:hypothetical protein H8356DRAFT_1635896 [Neocallimastix sp. JGI-2020a]ORY74246.1 hypothetical protein LY90DRAFT_378361 [Neocallimastix californiae]|eukprot:ORY74246.1 hypothetical protein LY90DRAFT_378361 [Neocallimastix californiae]
MNSLLTSATANLFHQRLAVRPLLQLNSYNGVSLINLKNYLSKTKVKKPMPTVHQLSFIIDGPAASGKTEISKGVSKKLGFNWIDSQAIYRALLLKCKNNNIEILPSNGKKISDLVNNTDFDFIFERDDDSYKVIMDNNDVTQQVKDSNISDRDVLNALSIPEITEAMKSKQRKLVYLSEDKMRKELEKEGEEGNSDKSKLYCTILEGRAAGKNVFPDAHLLFNLRASVDVRAERRFNELKGKKSKEAILEEMKEDEANFKELITPLKRALNITTTELDKDEQVETISFLIKDRIKRYYENIGPMY